MFNTALTIIMWQRVRFHYHCTDNHYMAGTFLCLSQYWQSLYGREFVSITIVPTIIIWQELFFYLSQYWNHYIAGSSFPLPLCRQSFHGGTLFYLSQYWQSLSGREFVSITAVPTIIPWRNFVLFITAPTISRELVSVNTVPTFHYMAGNLHPLKLYWHSTIWQEIYTR